MAKKQAAVEEVKPVEVQADAPVVTEEVKPVPLLRKFSVDLPGCPVGRVVHDLTPEDCDLTDDEACKAVAIKKYFDASGILRSVHQAVVFEVLK